MHSTEAQETEPTAPQQPAKPPPPQIDGDSMPPDEKKESPSADGYIPQEGQMHSVPAVAMNGGMPPQQVYVNTAMGHHGMTGLETQFHALGMNEGHDLEDGDIEDGMDNDDEDGEEDPVKLFVGQVRLSQVVVTMGEVPGSCVGIVMECHFLRQWQIFA